MFGQAIEPYQEFCYSRSLSPFIATRSIVVERNSYSPTPGISLKPGLTVLADCPFLISRLHNPESQTFEFPDMAPRERLVAPGIEHVIDQYYNHEHFLNRRGI